MESQFKQTIWMCAHHKDHSKCERVIRAFKQLRLPKSLKSLQTRKDAQVFRSLDLHAQDKKFQPRDVLLLFCSTSAAQDELINAAVANFKRQNDNILAILINGEPNATTIGQPDKECFVEAIRQPSGDDPQGQYFEPIAADIRSGTNKLAIQKLCAALLDVPLREITQRALLAKRIRNITIIVVSLLIAVKCATDAYDTSDNIQTSYDEAFDRFKDGNDD